MAQNKTVTIAPSTQPTAKQMRDWYEKNKRKLENYDLASDALKNLRDVTKSTQYKNISSITREDLRRYLENPTAYEKDLRNTSRYLVNCSQIYYRLIKYNANMFRLDARSVIPPYSISDKNDKKKIMQSYNDTLNILNKMGLQYEFLKVYVTCFIEDIYYGVCYFDEKSDVYPSMFFLQLNPDYCKVQGVWEDGTFAYAMDMSYFKKNKTLLEYWGEPFQSLYNEYEKTGIKWQTMPQEYSVCLKFRAEDWETPIPVFAGLLESILNLRQFEANQAMAADMDVYKLLVATIPLLSGSDNPDDFAVNPQLAIEYFNKLVDALPSYTDAVISPIPLDTINFSSDAGVDVQKVQTATKALLNTSGGSQILNSADLSTSAAFKAVVKADTEFAISSLLPQTEAWVNSFVARYVKTPSKVKFFEVSTYTIEDLRKEFLENAQNSLPTKLALNSMSGYSEIETLSLNFLEEECLNLSERFSSPLSTSYTQSANDEKEVKDDSELTDEGQKTRDQGKNDK